MASSTEGASCACNPRNYCSAQARTVAESGLPGFEVFGWNGVLAPAGTPQPVIAKLRAAMVEAMRDPEVRGRMEGFGFEPIGSTPEEFGEFLKADSARWAKVVKESGARVD